MILFKRFANAIFYTVTAFVLIAAIGTAISGKPMLMTAIRSNSMYPVFQRGDMILVDQLSDKDTVKIGDVVIFKTKSGNLSSKGWISHRIIGGNATDGYITKGDANKYSDQDSKDSAPIKREWIVCRVATIGKHPLKIPLIGYIPLWMEDFQKNTYTLPLITVILAIVIGISEITGSKRKKKTNSKFELSLIYFFSGLTISIMLAVSMLATSQHLNLTYEVSDESQGIIMGSTVGIMKKGEVIERPLSELNNKGFFPIIATITTDDPQITFSHERLNLKPGQHIKTKMKVSAAYPGEYKSIIHIGMFFPLLPQKIIYNLVKIDFWLALAVVSLIPGLPIMLYPVFERSLRRKTIKEIRRKIRRMKRVLSFS